jgi:hypothetical protein
MRRWRALGPGMRWRCDPGPGSRTAGGGGGAAVSMATAEREGREVGNLLNVTRDSAGLKF